MDLNDLAPVVLFAFNRPEHTRQTLEALGLNELAKSTQVYVFVDGPRNNDDIELVHDVVETVQGAMGFKSISITKREENFGLANSIVDGINTVLSEHERVIVLEDDIVTSPLFLSFMNEALCRYQKDKGVWHISGYNEPTGSKKADGCHFSRLMNCWGWGTWRDRWRSFEKNPEKLLNEFTPQMIDAFDLGVSEKFWFQVQANADGRLNTWAIFWYATIFKSRGLCLNPNISYVMNIGLDGSGEHCSTDEFRQKNTRLNSAPVVEFPASISEDPDELRLLQQFFVEKRKKKKVKKAGAAKAIVKAWNRLQSALRG